MQAGTTLHVPDPGASYDSHLWIIISDPGQDAEKVLIVNMTSWKPQKDQACILDVGDHPYIQHRTCINYREAKVVTLEQLHQLQDSGKIKILDPLSPALLKKIRAAVPDSQMKLENAELLEQQGLIEL
jgi:hypothetical protein